MREYLLSSSIGVLACLFCIWLLQPLAIRIGLVDRPNERKLHQNEVPLIGGIAIFFGFCFALLHLHMSLQPFRSLLSGSALLLLMGVVDDFHDLSAKLRLLGQVVVALMLTSWGGVQITNLGDILFVGNIDLYLWALPLTVVVVVANVNALNMIDGQDGLAGSIVLGQIFWLFLFAYELHLPVLEFPLVILAMLLLVFLCFNMSFPWRRQASIFLGDAGSTFLAFVVVWVAIQISQSNIQSVHPVEVLWVMALPLLDLLNVVIYRMRQKKSILQAGQDHLHHVLYFLGFRNSHSTGFIFLISFLFGLVGYLFHQFHVSEGVESISFITVMILYCVIVELGRQKQGAHLFS